MPTKKEVLVQKLKEWDGRDLMPVEEVVVPMPRLVELDNEDGSEDEGNMDDMLRTMHKEEV